MQCSPCSVNTERTPLHVYGDSGLLSSAQRIDRFIQVISGESPSAVFPLVAADEELVSLPDSSSVTTFSKARATLREVEPGGNTTFNVIGVG
jgi:hypothetical protein